MRAFHKYMIYNQNNFAADIIRPPFAASHDAKIAARVVKNGAIAGASPYLLSNRGRWTVPPS
jgi:hypothetical protein